MTDRFEKSVQDWYDQTRTANLELTNFSENQKPKLSDLHNDILCVYDKINLFAKVSIKRFHQILQGIEKIEQRLEKCEENIRKTQSETRKSLKQISAEIHEAKPLTKKQVLDLVNEIAQQPKLVEEQALKLSEDLNQKVHKVEKLLQEVKRLIAG